MSLLRSLARPVIRKIRGPARLDAAAALRRGSIVERSVSGFQVRWLITNTGDEIQSAQLQHGFYELAELRQLAEDIGPVRTVLDVGANIGNHAVFFATIMGAKELVLVEPFVEAADHLMINLALNPTAIEAITLHRCALGAAEARASLVLPTEFNIGLTRVDLSDPEQGAIRVRTGDQLGRTAFDLVKIDVEGAEIEVLHGLVETLRTQRPAIYIETSDQTREAAIQFLEKFGYGVHRSTEAYGTQYNLTLIA